MVECRLEACAVLLCGGLVAACGGGANGATSTSSAGGAGGGGAVSTTSSGAGGFAEAPPAGGAALVKWLEAKSYFGWKAESAVHASTGPHGSKVRAYVDAALLDSLAKTGENAKGSAAVKELYDGKGAVTGWAVAIKLADASDGGKGWHWYERLNGTTLADGVGLPGCAGCHAAGKDFFRSPIPLQ